MAQLQGFIDYYELLQISPNAELQTIQRAYRMLAARCHPDNPDTGDTDQFLLLQEAFRTLSNPDERASYDKLYEMYRSQPMPVFQSEEFTSGFDAEANRRLGVLCLLYNRRRSQPDRPAMNLLELESTMGVVREHLEFAIWYLYEKGFVRRDYGGDLQITADGVDHVEAKSAANRIVYKLLKAPEHGYSAAEPRPEPGDGRTS